MKKIVVVSLLLACFSPLFYGQKTRPGQLPRAKSGVVYTIKVHISGIHLRNGCSAVSTGDSCRNLYADATIDGKKIELAGAEVTYPTFQRFNVVPGDYKARLLKDPHKVNGTELYREYELLLPDNVIWQCTVTGISE